jgi:hypothetical protein
VIPRAGGAPRLLARARSAESPNLTPDGRGVLYVDNSRGPKLMYYDLAADTAFVVLDESSEGRYVATGHLVYAHPNGGLFAVRFDPKRHAVSGTPIPIVSDIQPNGSLGPFVITSTGTLAYRSGLEPEVRLLRRDPRGTIDTLPIAPSAISYARFSPDGSALALTVGAARGPNRYTTIYDLRLGTLSRFTLEGGGHSPIWSPDGSRLAFTAEIGDTDAEDLFVQPVDRRASPVRLVRMAEDQHASAWPSDSVLVFTSNAQPRTTSLSVGMTGGGILIANPSVPDVPPRPYLRTPWGNTDAVISPDGRHAAFTSNESGTQEIYIRPFPSAAAGAQWRVSSTGGQRARWAGDGRTVYYQGLDGKTIHAVRVHPGPPLTLGAREVVATIPGLGGAWDVDRASGRMVLTQAVVAAEARVVVMTNWLDHFRRGAGKAP